MNISCGANLNTTYRAAKARKGASRHPPAVPSDAIGRDHDRSRQRPNPEIELTRLVRERHDILVVNHPKRIIAQGDDSIPDVDGPGAIRDSTRLIIERGPDDRGLHGIVHGESEGRAIPSMMSIRAELTLLTYS